MREIDRQTEGLKEKPREGKEGKGRGEGRRDREVERGRKGERERQRERKRDSVRNWRKGHLSSKHPLLHSVLWFLSKTSSIINHV